MKIKISKSEKGLALLAVVVFFFIFIILGFSMLNLATPYEHAVYTGNMTGDKWSFSLRGQGDPKVLGMSGKESGGKDIVICRRIMSYTM